MPKRTIDWTATGVEAGQDMDNQIARHVGVWFGLLAPIGLALFAIWSLIIVGQSSRQAAV